jgi:hypothetical protein
VNVGVTGHRWNHLRHADLEALRASVRGALERLAAAAPGQPLRLVSPLAEGADRIAAEEAAALGWQLQGALPFAQAEYEKDFATAESRRQFRRLLERAAKVDELRGSRDSRDSRDSAYTAVGRLVLDSSDVLLAVWDGESARGEGGTAQMVREASERGIPVVWIPSQPPHEPRLLMPGAISRLSPEALADLGARFAKPVRPV